MVRRTIISSCLSLYFAFFSISQQPSSYDSLKRELLALKSDVRTIDLRLQESQSKFKQGILIATLGYTTTIAGGLMLGRSNDQTGQALLIVGGATGVIGTYKMVDAFSYLTGNRRKKKKNLAGY